MKVGDIVKLSPLAQGRASTARRKPRNIGIIAQICEMGSYLVMWQDGLRLVEIRSDLEVVGESR